MRTVYDVLLVEDDHAVQAAAARILRGEGLSVDLAEDVSAAVARLRHAEHRVVLSDLMLPGFSGFELLDRVVSDRPQLPVVLITGYATIENALHAFKRGAFDFLPKPFDIAELLGVIRRAMRCAEAASWSAFAPVRDLIGGDPAARPDRLRFLGQHAWAEIDAAGVRVGVAESFAGWMGRLVEVRLPRVGDQVTQGLSFAELAAADEAVHRVWAPLGGTVIDVNLEVRDDPGLLDRAPFSAGWLIRILPSALAEQEDALSLRNPAPVAAPRGVVGKEKRWSF